ncbi:P-II family nitrogen regulator [Prosthecochloris sp. N3]|uniref:P-II family nitrogen regulator n=1 Tax=Prosthecochloris ethylica TaxID=2743976 RepID=A0ABR9XTC7_9CHLB|nr:MULTISPECIES: P-II family nitrogen regulator [Prosthecochloris]MEC9486872.1 P-II family nitrogen regulator [Prosthecochloris sp.]MBF0585920.1 P-II family nitrogen regulator [Prosthecochloris ethylica]MBF0637075.1 P-II family nitrogen regulator [Prosthecochloris ethylica]NUK47312.1 P-II family nitrogen regulator [Prosthecochloris ethylica]RNA64102.1 P-II family nitrogen regulator [Prosthecochloris sp. ZM_2]
MKLITAIIQEDKLDEVREALIQADVTRISVSRISGHGRQEDIDIYRGRRIAPNLLPKTRIEIAVNEDFVEQTIDTIIAAARHGDGEIGDGKIFVTPLEECVRIRTGERGRSAI